MSIAGSSSGDDWKTSRSSWTWTSSPQSVGAPRAGEMGGGAVLHGLLHRGHRPLANLRFDGSRLLPAVSSGSVMKKISRMSPPHAGHSRGNSSPTGAISLAQAIRDVSWERGVACGPQQSPSACPASACPPFVASRCLPIFPFRQSRNRRPQRVIGRKHSVASRRGRSAPAGVASPCRSAPSGRSPHTPARAPPLAPRRRGPGGGIFCVARHRGMTHPRRFLRPDLQIGHPHDAHYGPTGQSPPQELPRFPQKQVPGPVWSRLRTRCLTHMCPCNMLFCMRTTMDIDDALLADAKRRAAEKGTTLTAFVEHALAAALARRETSRSP